jgi:hypothetical protein
MTRALVSFLLLSIAAFAQIDSGSIVGTVTDQTGAVIPGAAITVTNKNTGVVVTATTNSEGQYQVLGLIPGKYSVKASAAGMSPQDYADVEIHVQSRPALDFRLSIGEAQQVITVDAAAPLLQTQSAELGGVVGSKAINDLPLNGRVYAQLALLEVGAMKYYAGANETPDRIVMNGNSGLQNYFDLDGVDNNSGSTNLQEGSVQVVQPPPDALEEFRVQTRTYSAEFGTAAGGVINVSTKSGTNNYHGNLWEFLRNDKLDANTFFNNRNGTSRGRFSQNQYGGTFGGPILKNRTFFFGDFQGFSSRRAVTNTATVPTKLMKQGNFTELPYSLSSVVPGQEGCIIGNVVQPVCQDSVGKKLLGLYPDANIPSAVAREGTAGSYGGTNYQYPASTPNDTYSTDVRIDHTINDTNKVFGRYSYYQVKQDDQPWTANPLAGSSNFAGSNVVHGNSASLAWTDAFTPSAFNQLRAGFNRMFSSKLPLGDLTLGKSSAPEFGLTGVPEGPFSFGLPPISVDGVQGLGSSSWRPQQQISQVYQLMDDVSWLKGSHSLKFGYQYYRFNNSFLDIRSPQGSMTVSGIYTNNHGFGVADLLLGDMSGAHFTTPQVPHTFRPGHGFYAQDTWRATKKLTLNLGLRYELFAPLMDHNNEFVNFSPANGGGLVAAALDASGWEARSMLKPDRNNFAPRVGLAYQVTDRVVVRGGYGVFYQHANRFGSESVLGLNPPYISDSDLSQSQGSTTPVFYLREGFPGARLVSTTVDLTQLQIRAQDSNQRTSYVEQTSFGVQAQLSASMVASADYVGNFGHKMARIRNANQGYITSYDASGNAVVAYPYANLNDAATGQHAYLEYLTNDGNSAYNALQLSLRRRFGQGLSFGLSYAWSHNLSDYNTPINGNYTPQNTYNMSAERSNSALDLRHRFSANAIWALPVGKGGRLLNNLGRASTLIGGWQVNAIVTLQTGSPFTVTAADQSSTGGNHQSYASCIGDPFAGASTDPNVYLDGGSGYFINPAAFAVPASGHFGTCAPYSVHGPGMENVDMSLFKSFEITESKRVEFRTEWFNAFNHANFAAPNANISDSGSFGKVYSTLGNTNPREIQFGLKLYF